MTDSRPAIAPPTPKHARRNAWDAEVCACGTPLVSCHGCAGSRCLTCDPYSDYERVHRCCVTVTNDA